MRECDKCGERVETTFVDGMFLCEYCYGDYTHETNKRKEGKWKGRPQVRRVERDGWVR